MPRGGKDIVHIDNEALSSDQENCECNIFKIGSDEFNKKYPLPTGKNQKLAGI